MYRSYSGPSTPPVPPPSPFKPTPYSQHEQRSLENRLETRLDNRLENRLDNRLENKPLESRLPSGSRYGSPVGRLIEREPDLPGRTTQLEQLKDYLSGNRTIQMVGEARMGTTTTLQWLARMLEQERRSRVLVDARLLEAPTSTQLVLAVARGLDREAAVLKVFEHRQADPVRAVTEALQLLTPCIVLLDNADLLMSDPSFSREFFQTWRHLNERGNERGRLIWVSASRVCLYPRAKGMGPGAAFLNDAAKVWLGPLDPAAARRLLEGTGEPGRERVQELPFSTVQQAQEVTAGFVEGLVWMGERLWKSPEKLDELVDEYRLRFRPVFDAWWQNRDDQERELLRVCARERLDARSLRCQERRTDRQLVRRLESLGLMQEQNGYFVLPGSAWREYVENLHRWH